MDLFTKLIDIIYPPRCLICKEFLHHHNQTDKSNPNSFCQTCAENFQKISSPLCPICGVPLLPDIEEDHLCENCIRTRPFFDAARAPYFYEDILMTAMPALNAKEEDYLEAPGAHASAPSVRACRPVAADRTASHHWRYGSSVVTRRAPSF